MDYFVLTVASLILFAATFFSTVTGFGFALIDLYQRNNSGRSVWTACGQRDY